MARTKISEFSATPANNTDIDSINISEGCPPSSINDAIRELMSQLKDFQTGAVGDSFNGPIGSSTASTGAFTTLSATGAITSTLATGTAPLVIASTTKVANLNVDLLDGADWASPAALGSTTPAAVSATTLSASGNVTLSGGTANGVAYLNGSKVVTSGSALSFDGATLGVSNGSAGTAGISITGTYSGSGTVAFLNFQRAGGAVAGTLGYNDASTAIQFGTTTNHSTIFLQNNSEAMRLTSTGLGIGTSSPQAKLHVAQSASGVLFGQDSTTANIIGTNAAGTSSQGLFLKGFPLTFTGSGGGGTAQMTLNGDGNLGLGVTPSAWNSGFKALQVNGAALFADDSTISVFTTNAYYNTSGQYIYKGTDYATSYRQYIGTHAWFTAPSGTAGNSITFTQAMTLDASGNLAIGTTSAGDRLTVSGGRIRMDQDYQIVWQNAGTNRARIYGDSGNNILFENGSGNTERARIDSSGNLLIGTTSNTNSSRCFVKSGGVGMGIQIGNTVSNQNAIDFYDGSGDVCGSITINPSANLTTYNTTSDYRLKNITGPITTSGAYIDSLNPVEGTWKSDGSTFVGLIAHEVQEASRTTVATGVKDGEEMQGMDYSSSEIIANLIAEVKSLRKRLADAGI